jgi:uncharacterized protein (TIRG00374 family)
LNRIKFDIKRWMPFLIGLVVMIGLAFIVADLDQIWTALLEANWKIIPLALAATLISYTCVSFNFAQVSRLLGVDMGIKDLTIVGYVSSVINRIVLSAGAAGYSVRFMLMKGYGVTMREVVTISILHFYLTSLLMISMLPVGFIYLGLNAELGQTTTILLAIAALIVLLVATLATGLIFWRNARKKVVDTIVKAVDGIIRRNVSDPLERFDETMDAGVQAMRADRSTMVIIASLIAIDWVFSATTLWFCFRAFEVTLSPGELISGFVIGTVAGVASLFPGGLGIQEASMTGIFTLFGIPFEKAVLASILYRVIYMIIPYLLSLGFYRLVLRSEDEEEAPITQEAEYENPYA